MISLPRSIKNRTIQIPEIGRIKIGKKGDRRTQSGHALPVSQNFFTVTTTDKDGADNFVRDDAFHEKIGQDKPTSLDIFLFSDVIEHNYQEFYAWFERSGYACVGDGESATRYMDLEGKVVTPLKVPKPVACPCPLLQTNPFDSAKPPLCGISCRLACMLKDAESVGGAHIFISGGEVSAGNLRSSLEMIKAATQGVLAGGLPLQLRVFEKHFQKGKKPVVTIVAPYSPDHILEMAKDILDRRNKNLLEYNQVQRRSALLLAGEFEPKDFQDEFRPDAAEREQTAVPVAGEQVAEQPEKPSGQTVEPKVKKTKPAAKTAEVIKEAEVVAPDPGPGPVKSDVEIPPDSAVKSEGPAPTQALFNF